MGGTARNFEEAPRQETSANGAKKTDTGHGVPIAAELAAAMASWLGDGDARALRRALLDVLRQLDGDE